MSEWTGVKVIKFVSGQEIICKVVQVLADTLIVESPLTIQPMRTDPRNAESISLGLLPFSWGGVSSSVKLDRAHILCVLDAESGLATQYLAGLAGLSVPSQKTPTITL